VWKGHAADRPITYLDELIENLKAEVLAQSLMELVGDEYANIYDPDFVRSLSEADFDEMFYLRGIPRAAMVPHCHGPR
jgi:hypothetical protein